MCCAHLLYTACSNVRILVQSFFAAIADEGIPPDLSIHRSDCSCECNVWECVNLPLVTCCEKRRFLPFFVWWAAHEMNFVSCICYRWWIWLRHLLSSHLCQSSGVWPIRWRVRRLKNILLWGMRHQHQRLFSSIRRAPRDGVVSWYIWQRYRCRMLLG